MAAFDLRIETDPAQKLARLKLFRSDGTYLASNEIRLPAHSSALWEGLFDTRRYVERYEGSLLFPDQTEPATAAVLLARLGAFLGEEVMGPEILRPLAAPGRHVLVVRLPTPDQDLLAAAFARVPWEIARLPDGTRPRNLVVRAVTADADPQANPYTDPYRDPYIDPYIDPYTDPGAAQGAGETLRVLAVFAEAPGSRPLAMRREREELRRLFADHILPRYRVEIDLLCHGVTRRRIEEAIRSRRGYHLVHWSGHGHHNALELWGEPDNRITGAALVALFDEAGGFIPRVFFLSACHSGALLQATDWESWQAAMEQEERQQGPGEAAHKEAGPREAGPAPRPSPAPKQLDDAIADPSGYTGTALALLKTGVPQVVAMRYAVGDDYARRLALAFYRRLLGDPDPCPTDEALALARTDVAQDREQGAYHAVDHATPLLFGRPGVLLAPTPGRSPQMERLWPKPQPVLPGGSRELDPPPLFVGRGEALARLGRDWLGEPFAWDPAASGPAVALIQGLAGLGKTALAAEAIHLWHPRFDYVLAFQAKPGPLPFEDFCRRLDKRLIQESTLYRAQVGQNPAKAIDLPPAADAPARHGQMRANLLAALRAEAILLVIDNFETNLETLERTAGSALYACADPAWDALLAGLARDLPGTRSRLLVTSRHRPQALFPPAGTGAQAGPDLLWIPLGPLPMGEAGLFVRDHRLLRPLFFSRDEGDRALVQRLLKVSRGHPLILDRFARLAAEPAVLDAALARVKAQGWQQLPDLFEGKGMDEAQRAAERRYLEEVAAGSLDLLIERLTPDARRLLRVVTLANEPVSEDLLAGVWGGRSLEDERRDALAQTIERPIERLEALPDEDPDKQALTAHLHTDQGKQDLERLRDRPARPAAGPSEETGPQAGPPESAPAEAPEASPEPAPEGTQAGPPPMGPPLAELTGSGLLTREAPADTDPEGAGAQALIAFHELVRERATHWRQGHPDAGDTRTDDAIRIAYGERYAALFHDLYHQDRAAAGEAGRRALGHFLAAGAFERLGSFASQLVTGVKDPLLLQGLAAALAGAIDQAPPGEARWSLRAYLADALYGSGQPDRALPFYAQAAQEAQAAGDWSNLAAITGNWALAAADTGDLAGAKGLQLRSAEAARRAGRPQVHVIVSELAALRIDVVRGGAETALPEIEARLARIRDWWAEAQAGAPVPAAPDWVFLGRALVGALDIAEDANQSLGHLQACLDLLAESESAERTQGEGEVALARTRFNRYWPLLGLGRLDEAQRVLEDCLPVFRSAGDLAMEARCLGALAHVWDERNETREAIALERQALAVHNRLPAPWDRAVSHGNLGEWLQKDGQGEEAARHQTARLLYGIAMGRMEPGDFDNLRILARRALAAGGRYRLPPVPAILARPEFAPLQGFLAARGAEAAALQAELDRLLDEAHAQAQAEIDRA